MMKYLVLSDVKIGGSLKSVDERRLEFNNSLSEGICCENS